MHLGFGTSISQRYLVPSVASRGRAPLFLFLGAMLMMSVNGRPAVSRDREPANAENPAPRPSWQPLSEADIQELDRLISKFIEREIDDKDIPAISIAIVADGRAVLAKGFGKTDEKGMASADGSTVYRAGSISKLFTDLAVMHLEAAGKIDIDEDIRSYLPDFEPQNPFGEPITLRQLMSHQSGLVRESPVGHYFDDTSPSLVDTVKSLNDTTLVYEPGTRTKYSNAGVSVAGLVVEKVSGKGFSAYVRELLLEPLAMRNSSFERSDAVASKLATGWMRSHHAARFVAPDFALGTLPAGNLYASMEDLANLLIALLDDGKFNGAVVIDPAVLKKMLEPCLAEGERVAEYGIGFRLGEIDDHRTFGHGGAVYGFSAQLTGLPNEGIGVVAAASLDGANGVIKRISDYAIRLTLAMKGDRPLPPLDDPQAVKRELRGKLVGRFASGDKVAEIEERDGELYLHDGLFLKRLRQVGEELVVDDLVAYGPRIMYDGADRFVMNDRVWSRVDDRCPPEAPPRWRDLIGEYGWDHNPLYVFEAGGRLWVLIEWFYYYPLTEVAPDIFAFPDDGGLYHGEQLLFGRDARGKISHVTAASVRFDRRKIAPDEGVTFQVRPQAPIEKLHEIARAAKPPGERRPVREADLVELTALDDSLRLDVRYATKNNFMGEEFYRQPRAFMQRPAAEAVVRVHRRLKDVGYGLLIHDAYRPWYVTKMFWEGTPAHLRDFVADPEQGSKHNRGCAVDLTLFDLASGEPITMVAGYDEMTPRSYPYYPGGTARQRWHRRLLRRAMEREGFSIYPLEWWHFDYKDWTQYPIGNVSFEEIDTQQNDARRAEHE